MRYRMRRLVAVAVVFTVAACTSSGGGKPSVEKTGGGWFQARPLIMPAQRVTAVRPDPFASLHVPTSEDAYNKLSRAQRADLASALRGVDCAHPPHLAVTADRVVCDADSDVFLLGAALFTGNEVTRAKPLAPSASVASWQVSFMLTPDAAHKIHQWTSKHHLLVQSGAFNDVQRTAKSRPPCGPTTPTPCSYFTAYVSDSVVVTVPVWFAPVENTIEINGEFHKAFATRLAHRLAS